MVASDEESHNKTFMLLSRGAQRQKAKACEECLNYVPEERKSEVCEKCFWASPSNYEHVATKEERHVHIVFTSVEQKLFSELSSKAVASGCSLPTPIKQKLIEEH